MPADQLSQHGAGDPGTGPASAVTAPVGSGQPAALAMITRRLPGRAVQGLLVLAAYLAVFIVAYAAPLLRHPGLPQVYQASPDPNFSVWSLRWWPYALARGLNPLFSGRIGAPGGFNLAWTTPTAAVAVLAAPVTEWLGPVTSFSLTLLLAAPVSGWAAYLAARRLTGRFWAAVAAGTVYGFSWYEVGETSVGHLNLIVIMLLPLMVYAVLAWQEGKLSSRALVAVLAAAMAAEFYVFDETYLWMTLLGAVLLLAALALARPGRRARLARLARLAGLAWVISVAAASPYLIYSLRHQPAGGFAKVSLPGSPLNLHQLVSPWSGVVLLLIAAALLVARRKSRLVWLLSGALALTVLASLGAQLRTSARTLGTLPWHWLWTLPFLRSTEPLRIIIFTNLALALIVALWLGMPVRSRLLAALRWLPALAALAGILAYLPTVSSQFAVPAGTPQARPSAALPSFVTTGEYRRYLQPGETVVVVSDRGNAGLLFQAEMNFYVRLAGGFTNASFASRSGLPARVQALTRPTPAREQAFRAYVRRAGVQAVIVEQAWSAPWMRVFSRLGLPGTRAGGVIVYRTG